MIEHGEKILDFETASQLFDALRGGGKTLVHCHGTFDLIHPGHIYHFEEAREFGDVLVVTFTSEDFVNKGPGRPFFNDELRAKSLAALDCVDYVVAIPYPAAVEAIECVKPQVYCKGKEYEDTSTDVTGNIENDVTTVEKHGGRMEYVGSVVFSSTRLLNRHFQTVSDPVKSFCERLSRDVNPDDFRDIVDSLADIKVLVIGDTIFDRYSSLHVQGLTSKNRILSGRLLGEATHAGGALAVFRHLKQFTPNAKLISLAGTEAWVDKELRRVLSPEEDLVLRDPDFTTVVKQRFVEPTDGGSELSKLFAVNYIDESHPGPEIQQRVLKAIEDQIDDFDFIMVMDFGHGLLENKMRRFLEECGPMMALNCQTNSNNHGFNIINHKYRRADMFTLDQAEITLACGERQPDWSRELRELMGYLDSDFGWLTRGDVETVGLHRQKGGMAESLCPPLELDEVVDTVGAGDAFFTLASLATFKGLPIDMGTFLGQLAGAQAVRIVGNEESISKSRLLKGGMTLLNF